MKYLILAALLLAATPAAAQVQYFSAGKKMEIQGEMQGDAPAATDVQPAAPEENLAPQTRVVTSVQKCIDQLDPEDQAIVRSNYNKQYQTCYALLAQSAKKKKTEAASVRKKKSAEPVAENARTFVRVRQEDDAEEPAATGDDAAIEEESAPKKRRHKDKGSWFSRINADKSKASFNN